MGPFTYCIINIYGEHWDNEWGWIDTSEESYEEATFSIFSEDEKKSYDLPVGGSWCLYYEQPTASDTK